MIVECVILAAGLSSRMGKNKMLLKIDGKTAIERCVQAFDESCSKIIVVTGRYHDDIQKCLAPYDKVRIVYHPDYMRGMFSSVKAGIKHAHSERFFLTPGDYPLLKPEVISQMMELSGCLVVPEHHGEQGHPVLLHQSLIPLILHSASSSLRDCIDSIAPKKQILPIDDIGVVTDMDTDLDYQAISYPFVTH